MYAKKIREIERVANKNSTQTSLNVILDNNVKFSKKNKRFFPKLLLHLLDNNKEIKEKIFFD